MTAAQERERIAPSQSQHDFHMHCLARCEKTVGVIEDGKLVCIQCGAPFVECTPEICDV